MLNQNYFAMLLIIFLTVHTPLNIQGETEKWETLATINQPTGRHENAFVEYNGMFYLLGGRQIKHVEVFNPLTNTWRQLSKVPVEMHHFQAISINDIIYVIGAMTGSYPTELPLENIYQYNPVKDAWTKGPEIPEERRRGSCGTVFYKGKIYMIGGIQYGHTSGTVNWFDVFDPKSGRWEVLPDAPNIRDHFPGIVVKNKLYCIGGRNTSYHEEGDFEAFFNATVGEIDVYDFNTGKWETLNEKLPIETAAGSVAYYNNKIIYFGGESLQSTAHNETQALNLETGKWEQLAPLQRGRHGTQAIQYKNKIYITAGSGNRGGTPELTSTEVFRISE